jgi:recombination protein RecA
VAEFDMMHADGISAEGDLLDLGMTAKLIEKSGSWIRYGETHLGQGREKARLFLKENPEVAADIRQKIIASREPLLEVEKEAKADGDDAE